MKAYQARLEVSRHRDPFLGIPEAIPSPVPSQRLEDFTIDQLVREEVIHLEAEKRGITVSDHAVQSRIDTLRARAGGTAFAAALSRNGFTAGSFLAYQGALLTEVALVTAMAKDRAGSAAHELQSGQSFSSVAARWSDDAGTFARGGDVGWLPEYGQGMTNAQRGGCRVPVRQAIDRARRCRDRGVEGRGMVRTDRGFTIATVLERRADQVHLAVILVLAPTVDVFSPQGTPTWFTKFIDDRVAALRRDRKLAIKVGSHAGS